MASTPLRAQQAGNPGTTGISDDVVFTVDTVAPTSAITSGPGAISGAHSQEIAFAASEPGVTFRCAVDGRQSKPCVSPVRLAHLKLGRHTFAIRATDAAGNVQRVPTRRRWRVVSLATALVPRLADVGQVLSGGLPIAAACADRCRISARLDLPGRGDPLMRVAVVRTRAGAFALRLRPTGSTAAALGATAGARARLTLVVRARGSEPVAVTRTIALVRGTLRTVAAHGLPVTVACSSACSARSALWVAHALARRIEATGQVVSGGRQGLPRGARYVSLGTRRAQRGGAGANDLTLPIGRIPRARLSRLGGTAAVRVTASAGGPDTPDRAFSLPLALSR